MNKTNSQTSPGKRVYLFELDSVINSEEECRIGREKLYMELMKGNIVVLSYNQLSSMVMYDLLDIAQEKYTKTPIINLMESGRICVSQYKNGTIAGYLTQSLRPGGPFFVFSGLHFLNDFLKNTQNAEQIKDAFHNQKPLNSWKDLETDELTKEEKMILVDYITIMVDVIKKIKHIPALEVTKDLKYYIEQVTLAVQKSGCVVAGVNVGQAVNLLKQAATDAPQINRSAIQEKIKSNKVCDKKIINFARAMLDMSYNYQIERSISDITITHDLSDANAVSELVKEYYERHDYVATDTQCSLNKPVEILHWEAVDSFCSDVKDTDVVSNKAWNNKMRNNILKRLFSTIGLLAFVILIWIIANITDGASSEFLSHGLLLGNGLILLVYVLLETVNFLMPTSPIDGIMSAISLFRYYRTYRLYQKGECGYIKINLKERLNEKFGTKSENDE